jgi:hypothetical protein
MLQKSVLKILSGLYCLLIGSLIPGNGLGASIQSAGLSGIAHAQPHSANAYQSQGDIQVEGKVLEEESGPIGYVNIGIPDSRIGTVSNEDGTFELTIPESYKADTLRFSAIGYHPREIPVKVAKQQGKFFLEEKVYQSEKVTIKEREGDYQTEKLGDWKPLLGWNYACSSPEGCKMVERLEMDLDSAYLKTVRIWIGKNEDTSAKARVWVFEENQSKPGAPLLKAPVIQQVPLGKDWMTFDVADQSIRVKDDFFVGIEFLNYSSSSNDGPYVGCRYGGDQWTSWQMFNPQSGWEPFENDFVMQAIVSYYPRN